MYENYYLHDRDCGHFYPTSYGAGRRICVDAFYFCPHCCMICEFWLFWFSLCRSVTPSDCTSWEKRSHRDERHETSRLLSAKTQQNILIHTDLFYEKTSNKILKNLWYFTLRMGGYKNFFFYRVSQKKEL